MAGHMMEAAESEWRRSRVAARSFGAARRSAVMSRWARRMGWWIRSGEPCCEGCCDSLKCIRVSGTGRTSAGRSLQTVELGKIVGSIGRCAAFDADFRPACSCTKDRWESVYSAMTEGKSLPPVHLYRVGERYFVLDGNHRVSVARSMGLYHLEALVTEVV